MIRKGSRAANESSSLFFDPADEPHATLLLPLFRPGGNQASRREINETETMQREQRRSDVGKQIDALRVVLLAQRLEHVEGRAAPSHRFQTTAAVLFSACAVSPSAAGERPRQLPGRRQSPAAVWSSQRAFGRSSDHAVTGLFIPEDQAMISTSPCRRRFPMKSVTSRSKSAWSETRYSVFNLSQRVRRVCGSSRRFQIAF